MTIEVLADPDAVAHRAAAFVAAQACTTVAHRGRFVMAVSGGTTPWAMLRALARTPVPWDRVQIVQVDERVAPDGHADRNLTHLCDSLRAAGALDATHVHAMPVSVPDLDAGAAAYAETLCTLAGRPARLDLVHLGLGPDGHTASLVPGDAVLDRDDVDVAATGAYQGRRRMTLTYPILNRARQILWLIVGAGKADMLRRLRDRDPAIPAGRVQADRALVLADRAAARAIQPVG